MSKFCVDNEIYMRVLGILSFRRMVVPVIMSFVQTFIKRCKFAHGMCNKDLGGMINKTFVTEDDIIYYHRNAGCSELTISLFSLREEVFEYFCL